jgi:membrane peptidoglycan carboxypeptidase
MRYRGLFLWLGCTIFWMELRELARPLRSSPRSRVRPAARAKVLPVAKPKKRQPYKMRLPQILWIIPMAVILGFGAVLAFFAAEEMRTSRLQAAYLSNLARDVHFELGNGVNPELHVPPLGPYNQRLGYSYLPAFIKSLGAEGYTVAQQTRASARYQTFLDYGFYPIYRPKTSTGLALFDRNSAPLYGATYPSHVFADFASVPPLLVNTLLYIENRELLLPGPVTRNPVIEWKRFCFAVFGHVFQKFMPGLNAGGGSTLATQIEKFRFSPGGQTGSVPEKLRQIASASLRVYMDGPDTRASRERIVLDYLNSTPLSARQGFGEINSLGDGLWAWFGHDLNDVIVALNLPETDRDSLRVKAVFYREILGLFLAQRRPTYYLLASRDALDDLTDSTLERLFDAGVISDVLRRAAREARFRFLPEPPAPQPVSFIEQKAVNVLRNHLLTLLGLKKFYELDRLDLNATSTLDQGAQKQVTAFLKKMGDPAFVQSLGLYGFRLLNPDNDPSKIKWSVVLFERGEDGNRLRVQADNVDGPFDMNEGVKLDLGSTAKLRTLVTYLEIVSELYRRYAGLSDEDLADLAEEAPDALTSWATTWLKGHPDATLEDTLGAAMDRHYSANPGETFFTGSGAHHFVNFEKEDNGRIMPVHEALRNSVNLVFIRVMRDIVNYTIGQGQQTKEELLSDPEHPARKEYLERYADREGSVFLTRYMSDYAGLPPDEALEKITQHAHKGATARTILFRSIRPQASFDAYRAYMSKHMTADFDEARLPGLYRDYPADRYNLADRSYIAGINPLELWLVSYQEANPGASRGAILSVSRPVRIESYAWLFHPRMQGAQNTRIRILLELDAFARIQQRWARLGYPFDKLVPSYATAIGSSADRPGALAELVGIILNGGIKKPTLRFEKLHFAKDTPYETVMSPGEGKGVQVLDPAIARVVRTGMADVVENGTARRLRGTYTDAEGHPLPVGGKTGTGDHRFDEFAAGGRLISSRVVNRTGTIVFYIGDKFFGTVTAHVAGEDAAAYKFTSALSAQMLKSLRPVLQPIITLGVVPAVAPAAAPPSAPKARTPKRPAVHERPEPNEGNGDIDEATTSALGVQ